MGTYFHVFVLDPDIDDYILVKCMVSDFRKNDGLYSYTVMSQQFSNLHNLTLHTHVSRKDFFSEILVKEIASYRTTKVSFKILKNTLESL